MQFYAFNDGGQTFYVQGSNPMNALAALRNWLQSRGWGATDVASVSERDLQPVSEQGVNKGYLVNASQTRTARGGQGEQGGTEVIGLGAGQGGGSSFGPQPAVGSPGGLENRFPFAAYLNSVTAQGGNPNGVFGNYYRSRYQPATGVFDVSSALGGNPGNVIGDPDNAFANFVKDTPVGNIRQRATEAFRTLSGGTNGLTGDQATALKGYLDPFGESGSEDIRTSLRAMARDAAGTKYSPFAASRLLPDDDSIQENYQRQGATGSYIDFLRQKLGLASGF